MEVKTAEGQSWLYAFVHVAVMSEIVAGPATSKTVKFPLVVVDDVKTTVTKTVSFSPDRLIKINTPLFFVSRVEEFSQTYAGIEVTSVDKSENSLQFSYIILR